MRHRLIFFLITKLHIYSQEHKGEDIDPLPRHTSEGPPRAPASACPLSAPVDAVALDSVISTEHREDLTYRLLGGAGICPPLHPHRCSPGDLWLPFPWLPPKWQLCPAHADRDPQATASGLGNSGPWGHHPGPGSQWCPPSSQGPCPLASHTASSTRGTAAHPLGDAERASCQNTLQTSCGVV